MDCWKKHIFSKSQKSGSKYNFSSDSNPDLIKVNVTLPFISSEVTRSSVEWQSGWSIQPYNLQHINIMHLVFPHKGTRTQKWDSKWRHYFMTKRWKNQPSLAAVAPCPGISLYCRIHTMDHLTQSRALNRSLTQGLPQPSCGALYPKAGQEAVLL